MSDPTEQARWLRRSVGVRPLDVGILRVSGPDRREWLQGQVTNDVRALEPGGATYTFLVSVRGKILADAFVLDRGESLDLVLDRSRLGAMAAHLERYIVMEDVELSVLEAGVVTAQGPRAAELGGFPCDRLGLGGGVDVVDGSLESLASRARALGGGPVDAEGWHLARLRAARPELGADFDEARYPQETGLEGRAVSFTKGCYVGQEVVCTLKDRGRVRRRMVQLFGPREPERGAALRVDGEEVGVVTSHVHDPEAGGSWALGYLAAAHARPGRKVMTPAGWLTVREVVGGAEPAATL